MDHQQNTGWMWTTTNPKPTKRKAEYYDSWEERAFAEDAAGVLGSSGCVWPPRSYTCTFCRREFRSAQALGGHMNVHRRDRARLKQLPNTPQDQQQQQQSPPNLNPNQTLLSDLNYKKYPSQGFTTFVYGTSPNPNNSNALLPSFGANHHSDYARKEAKIIEVEVDNHEGVNSKCLINSDLSISLNLVVRRNRNEEETSSCFKRRKIVVATSPEQSPPLIFSSKAAVASCGEVDHKSKIDDVPREVLSLNNCSTSSKEIDLELRLGG